jgi:hypothetical protein
MACLRIEPESRTKITAIYQFLIYFHHFLVIMQRIFPYLCVSFDKYIVLPSLGRKISVKILLSIMRLQTAYSTTNYIVLAKVLFTLKMRIVFVVRA